METKTILGKEYSLTTRRFRRSLGLSKKTVAELDSCDLQELKKELTALKIKFSELCVSGESKYCDVVYDIHYIVVDKKILTERDYSFGSDY
jgi:hypothetical protein